MTAEKLDQLLARQMPDAEKRKRADFVVDTGGSFAETDAQVDKIVESLQGRAGTAYDEVLALTSFPREAGIHATSLRRARVSA